MSEEVNELLRQIRKLGNGGVQVLQGVVESVDGETCSVTLAGDIGSAPGFRWLVDGYTPAPGDSVFVIKFGPDKFILGRTIGESRNNSPFGMFSKSSPVSVADDSDYDVPIDTVLDADGVFSIASSVSTTKSGLYRVAASVEWASNSSGYRSMQFIHNGSVAYKADRRSAASGQSTVCDGHRHIRISSPEDTIELRVRQTSGVSLNCTINELTMQWVRP